MKFTLTNKPSRQLKKGSLWHIYGHDDYDGRKSFLVSATTAKEAEAAFEKWMPVSGMGYRLGDNSTSLEDAERYNIELRNGKAVEMTTQDILKVPGPIVVAYYYWTWTMTKEYDAKTRSIVVPDLV